MNYVLAPVLAPDSVGKLKLLIKEHHEMFKELYPACNITPKMHYPECIEK